MLLVASRVSVPLRSAIVLSLVVALLWSLGPLLDFFTCSAHHGQLAALLHSSFQAVTGSPSTTPPPSHPFSSLFHPSPSTPHDPIPSSSSFSPLLRSPLSHHAYASLFDKLHRGEPVRIAVIGGSISEARGWFLRERFDLAYFQLFVDHLNLLFPVTPPSNSTSLTANTTSPLSSSNSSSPSPPPSSSLLRRLTAFDSLIDHRDPARTSSPWAHKLANFAAGGTGTPSASFCWSSLFIAREGGVEGEGEEVTVLPDLLLIDYAVNDAYILAGSMMEDSAEAAAGLAVFPLSPLHSLDRLLRSVLLTGQQAAQPIAVVLLYFASSSRRAHKSVQAMHDRVARHYGVTAIRWRDHLTQPAVRTPFPVTQPQGVDDQGTYYDGTESIHPNPQGHYVMGQLLIRHTVQLYDNYQASQRSSLADPWLLSGHVASTSVRMKDRPAAMAQAADEVTEVHAHNMDTVWRVVSDIDHADVADWQEAVTRGGQGGGEGLEPVEPILPPILSLPPLPLPPALHPLNQDVPASFFCRKSYAVYIGEHVYQPYDHIERWFGVQHSALPFPFTDRPRVGNNCSADGQWLFVSTAKSSAKHAFSPHPDYLALRERQPALQLPLPSMTVAIPRVSHSATLFYLRTWQPMATAEVHLYCSSQPEVRSPVVILNGSWASPTSQASATSVYASPRLLRGPSALPGPDCFDRLHVQLREADDFRIVGYAVA